MSSQHAMPQTVVPNGVAAPLTHLTSQPVVSLGEDVAYTPVPPRQAFTISVELRAAGRGKPLPYPDEDDHGA